MTAFTLSREQLQQMLRFPVAVSRFENGVEQRRAITANPERTFRIRSPKLTPAGAKTYEDFIIGQFGPLTQFTFTYPIDGTTYNVRFDAESFNTTYQGGTCVCEFAFVRVP